MLQGLSKFNQLGLYKSNAKPTRVVKDQVWCCFDCKKHDKCTVRMISSVGRASDSRPDGHRFKSGIVHIIETVKRVHYALGLILDMCISTCFISMTFTLSQDIVGNWCNNILKLWRNTPVCVALEKPRPKNMLKKTIGYWSKDFNRFCVEVRISDSALWLFFSVVVRLRACDDSDVMTTHALIYHCN